MSFALLCRDKEACVVADRGLAVWEFRNTLWFFAGFFFSRALSVWIGMVVMVF